MLIFFLSSHLESIIFLLFFYLCRFFHVFSHLIFVHWLQFSIYCFSLVVTLWRGHGLLIRIRVIVDSGQHTLLYLISFIMNYFIAICEGVAKHLFGLIYVFSHDVCKVCIFNLDLFIFNVFLFCVSSFASLAYILNMGCCVNSLKDTSCAFAVVAVVFWVFVFES